MKSAQLLRKTELIIKLYIVGFMSWGGGEEYIYVYGNLGCCHAELQKWDKAIEAYMRTFQCGTPRGEMCVGIGYAMMAQQKYKEAIRWYLGATRINCPTESLLCNPASYTWIPYFQLSLCYSHLGDYEKAYHYNELAANYISDHPAVLYNRQYFNILLQSKE